MDFEEHFKPKRENIKVEIFCVTQNHYNMLEISTEKIFGELEDRFEKLSNELKLNDQQTQNYFDSKNKIPDLDFISKLDTSQRILNELNWVSDHLKILTEMRIIHLFKSVELNLKSIIKIAYPKTESKYFYNWENLNSFFKSLEINYSKCEGYNEVNDLRKVNNSIKHNSTFSYEIKNILEFKNNSEIINYKNYNKFYNRVITFANIYVKKISEAIILERFDFNDEKLNKLTEEFKMRMDKTQLDNFINKLKE